MSVKQVWIAVSIFIIALLSWFLVEPITNLVTWLWKIDAAERTKIMDIVRIFAGIATVGSFFFAGLSFFKTKKNPQRDSRDLLKNYYQALYQSCEKIDLALVNVKFTEYASSMRNAITLPAVYQEMNAVVCHKKKSGAEQPLAPDEPSHRELSFGKPLIQVSAEAEHKRVIILGDPGAGKSMFMDHLAWQVAASHLGKTVEDLPKEFRRLPVIRLRLRTLAWWCKQHGFEPDTLLNAMQREVGNLVGVEQQTATWQALQTDLMQEGIILLDGLDEVPETDGMRKHLLDAIDELFKQLQPNTHLIITSRPYVFNGDYAYWLDGFSCLELQEMDNEQVEQFIIHWYLLLRAARERDEATSRQLAQQLYQDLLDRNYLLEPARRPLILTLLTTLHCAYGILPHSRAQLYQEAIDLMLERWTSRASRGNQDYPLEEFEKKALAETVSTRKTALQALALEAHKNKTLQLSELQIKGLFSNYLSADCNPTNLLDFLRFRSGLLKPGTGNNFEFYHRSFQAYLSALAMTDLDNWQDEMDRLLRAEGTDWWAEVFLLLVSAKIAGNSKPEIISFLSSCYVPENINYKTYPESEWRYLLLAAQATLEQNQPLQGYQSKAYLKLLKTLEQHLLHLVQGEYQLPIKIRAEAGRLLGELGDPRQGITIQRHNGDPIYHKRQGKRHTLPDIDWVKIPAGSFLMGTEGDEAYEAEKPAHTVHVPEFYISRSPITNAQYRCFLEAGLYEDLSFWREKLPLAASQWLSGSALDEALLETIAEEYRENYRSWLTSDTERRQPRFWIDKPWNLDNHPVFGVSWFEALAYSLWLNELGAAVKPKGLTQNSLLRLPSEEQWEYAARGAAAWRYAWGMEADKQLGNYADTGLQGSSAVGLFPPSLEFGLYDMSGNVWEWTTSRWGKDFSSTDFNYAQWQEQQAQRNQLDPMEFRIIRGGSWLDSADALRCAVRYGDHPHFRSYYLGFRIVNCP